MHLPNGHLAIVTDEKLFNFLLNKEHKTQPGHADLFHGILGITAQNGELLRSALLEAAGRGERLRVKPLLTERNMSCDSK